MKRICLLLLGAMALLLAVPAMAADTVYYYLSDSLHSEVVVTDQNRNVVEQTYYAPYGQVLNRDLRDGPGYTGHEEDPATGLVYMQQRYYDPQSGRFLSTDPVLPTSDGEDFNRYWYANDNPYRYTDPDGRCTFTQTTPCITTTSHSQMQLSKRGLQFVKQHEGLKLKPYRDSSGNPTIGYGHLIRQGENFSKGITQKQASGLLRKDVKATVTIVNSKLKVTLSQTKFDAVTDFTYNLGGNALGKSNLLGNINAGKSIIKGNFTSWDHNHKGQVVPGLLNRRTDEYNLYQNGDYDGH